MHDEKNDWLRNDAVRSRRMRGAEKGVGLFEESHNRRSQNLKKACAYFAFMVLHRRGGDDLNCSLEEVLKFSSVSGVTGKIVQNVLEKEWEAIVGMANDYSRQNCVNFFRDASNSFFDDIFPAEWAPVLRSFFQMDDGDVIGCLISDEGYLLADLFERSPAHPSLVVPYRDEELFALIEMRMYVLQPACKVTGENFPDNNYFPDEIPKLFFGTTGTRQVIGERTLERRGAFRGRSLSTWDEISRVLDFLQEDGICVALVPDRTLVSSENNAQRKLVAIMCTIELVIQMPGIRRGSPPTALSTSLVVIRKKSSSDDHQMVMINARTASVEALCSALETWKRDGVTGELEKETVRVSREQFFDNPNGYTLAFKDYQCVPSELAGRKDLCPLGSVCDIIRGASPASSWKEYVSYRRPNEAWVRYATQADITPDGRIVPSQYIPYSVLSERDRGALVSSGVVIITRLARPFKCAVLQLKAGEQLLVDSNLYALSCHPDELDPHYLRLFLESDAGRKLMGWDAKSFGRLFSFSYRSLEALRVGCPPIEKQQRFAEEYKILLDQIELTQAKLAVHRQRLKDLMGKI